MTLATKIERLGDGLATYSTASGKLEMVGYTPNKPREQRSTAEHIVHISMVSQQCDRHKTAIERALERISPQCTVCGEFNGANRPHHWYKRDGAYFNICCDCLALTLLKDGSAIPDWIWELHPKYGYGCGAQLCRFVRSLDLAQDFLRCFDGKLPAAIMRASARNDFGYAPSLSVDEMIEQFGVERKETK